MPDANPVAWSARYEVSPDLLLKRWGAQQAVVFHPASNSTHRVDVCAGNILAALIERPGSKIGGGLVDQDERQCVDALAALLQAGMVRQMVG